MTEPVAIVFFPENPGATPAIEAWRERNAAWRHLLDQVIICPVCGVRIRAIADFALLDPETMREEIRRYQDQYLRAACSEHYYPTEQYWALVSSRDR